MKFVVLGYHNIGCRCLDVLVKNKEDVPAVFTHHDNQEENLWFDSMGKLAESYKIPCYYPENINDPKWVSILKKIAPEIIFSFYFRQMLSKEILEIPTLGAINMHGSLLPKYRGRCPVNWVILNGEKETGLTLHYMLEKPDAGDIISQKKVPIDFSDTAFTLFKKMEKAAAALLEETLPLIKSGTQQRIKNDISKGSYFGGRKPEDGKINWRKSNTEIYNLVRAVTHPYPGGFSLLGGKKMFIWECTPSAGVTQEIPGKIIVTDNKKGLIIATGKGVILVKKCQMENEPEMVASEFINKYNPLSGKILE